MSLERGLFCRLQYVGQVWKKNGDDIKLCVFLASTEHEHEHMFLQMDTLTSLYFTTKSHRSAKAFENHQETRHFAYLSSRQLKSVDLFPSKAQSLSGPNRRLRPGFPTKKD